MEIDGLRRVYEFEVLVVQLRPCSVKEYGVTSETFAVDLTKTHCEGD